MQTLLLVGLGGFSGAIVRYSLSLLIEYLPVTIFTSGAWSVLLVNNSGGFLAGILMERIKDADLRLLIITGFLGSFTTFSAFSKEGMKIYYDKELLLFFGFVFLNIIGALLFYQLGYYLSK